MARYHPSPPSASGRSVPAIVSGASPPSRSRSIRTWYRRATDAADARAAALRTAFREGGEAAYWRKRLELARGAAEPSSYELATLHARLGETQLAVDGLQAAFERRDYNLLYLRTNPAFDALRSHPVIADLRKRIGLPE